MASSLSNRQFRNLDKVNGLKKQGFLFEVKKNKILFLMLLPALIYFLIFNYLPMMGVIVAFKKYTYSGGIFGSAWNGVQNFDFFFRSGSAWTVTRNTVIYNVLFIITGMLLQIAVAIFIAELNSRFVKKYLQSAMLLPFFISWVVVGTFVYNLFNFEVGTLNHFLQMFGGKPIDVYGNPNIWPGIIVFFNNWKALGYNSLIFLAALLGIDETLYEAAKIDGSSRIQRIRYITLPLLMPTIAIMLLLALGQVFRGNFDLFYNVVGNNGTLFNMTDVIDTYVFRSLIHSSDIGMTAAAGLYQSFLCFIIIMTINTIIKKANPEYALF